VATAIRLWVVQLVWRSRREDHDRVWFLDRAKRVPRPRQEPLDWPQPLADLLCERQHQLVAERS
jgi:hypothetical protein